MPSVKINVSGRVQGVSFRFATQQQAQRLGVDGYVQNLPDGSVEIHAQAPESALETFIAWCHQGPPAARVERVAVSSWAGEERLTGFRIL